MKQPEPIEACNQCFFFMGDCNQKTGMCTYESNCGDIKDAVTIPAWCPLEDAHVNKEWVNIDGNWHHLTRGADRNWYIDGVKVFMQNDTELLEKFDKLGYKWWAEYSKDESGEVWAAFVQVDEDNIQRVVDFKDTKPEAEAACMQWLKENVKLEGGEG